MAASAEPVADRPLHFVEAIAYFRGKTNVPTRSWSDLMHGAHARAWSVAGATSDALLSDLRGAIDRAIAEGGTLEQFRAAFDEIVDRHGWSYRGGRNWRSRVIFQTNVRMAYAAGRWDQIQRLKATRPWLRYVAVQDGRTRPEHMAWHDTVLPADDPWWRTHYPPNGWNCRCTVMSLSDRDLDRYGLEPSEASPPVEMEGRAIRAPDGTTETIPTPTGIDTGFGYNPGDAWLRGVVPTQLRVPLPAPPGEAPPHGLPPLSVSPLPETRLMPSGLPAEAYLDAFLSEFGGAIDRPVMIRDVAGARITISDELFRDYAGNLKILKNGRERYVLVMADALRDPDEVWLLWTDVAPAGSAPQYVLRRRYLRRFDIGRSGDPRGGLMIFEWTAKGWDGVTAFPPTSPSQVDRQREGVLIYRRP